MKSAIGIGALLMDGLGDTIRVSLTEDPEYEIDPCSRLANLGKAADAGKWGVAPFKESRDTHSFSRRVGELPQQKEGDALDYRPLLHRCAAAALLGVYVMWCVCVCCVGWLLVVSLGDVSGPFCCLSPACSWHLINLCQPQANHPRKGDRRSA